MSSAPTSTRHTPRGIADLVDQRIRRWQLEREKKSPAQAEPVEPHVLLLSREVGAGGAEVARLVAEELELDLWDREIVHEIAEQSGIRESLLATLDEQGRGLLAQLRDSLTGHADEHVAYARRLTEVVQTVAHHGDALILGRGAQFIVHPAGSLAVRLVAPIENRAARVAAREGSTQDEALKDVESRDRGRHAFTRQYFGEDDSDPRHYDLIVNTGRTSLKQAATIIAAAYRTKLG